MRLVVARCEVTYTGRLNAYLPEAIRLLVFKADGSVLVHADSGGYKPLNWMTPPTVIENGDDVIVVRKRAGRSEDRLEIRIAELLAEFEHELGEECGQAAAVGHLTAGNDEAHGPADRSVRFGRVRPERTPAERTTDQRGFSWRS